MDCMLNREGDKPATMTGESDSDDEDPQDEAANLQTLLVCAWKERVFPTIKRRFRNPNEQRDGLGQIVGALELGMMDLARQIVEFLYDENGGIPQDLHLPTIEDVKQDLGKFSLETLRAGTQVQLKAADRSNLPNFAIRQMKSTFGLTGSVLEVDSASGLVQVDVYIPLEGILSRYWYPIDSLMKPEHGTRGAKQGTLTTAIHKELVYSEYMLSLALARELLLKLLNFRMSGSLDTSRLAARASTPIDVDQIGDMPTSPSPKNVFFVTTPTKLNKSITQSTSTPTSPAVGPIQISPVVTTPPSPSSDNVRVLEPSSQLAPCSPPSDSSTLSPFSEKLTNVCDESQIPLSLKLSEFEFLHLYSASVLATAHSGGRVENTAVGILTPRKCVMASGPLHLFYQYPQEAGETMKLCIKRSQAKGELNDLTNHLCLYLRTAHKHILHDELRMTSSESHDVLVPGAAFMIVCVKFSSTKSRAELEKTEQFKKPFVRVYTNSGHRLNSGGVQVNKQVMCYPCLNKQSGSRYPSVLLPGNKLHIKIEGNDDAKDVSVQIFSIPPALALALTYIQLLCAGTSTCSESSEQITSAHQPTSSHQAITSVLQDTAYNMRWQYNGVQLTDIPASIVSQATEHLIAFLSKTPLSPAIKQIIFPVLAQALRKLPRPHSGLSNVSRRFATKLAEEIKAVKATEVEKLPKSLYMQHLVDLHSAFQDLSLELPVEVSTAHPLSLQLPETGGVLPVPAPFSPSAQMMLRKKRLTRDKTTPKKADGAAGSNTDTNCDWLDRVCNILHIVRGINGEACYLPQLADAVTEAQISIQEATSASRVLVLAGIQFDSSAAAVKHAILQVMNKHGGLYHEDLWLPLAESTPAANLKVTSSSSSTEPGASTVNTAEQSDIHTTETSELHTAETSDVAGPSSTAVSPITVDDLAAALKKVTVDGATGDESTERAVTGSTDPNRHTGVCVLRVRFLAQRKSVITALSSEPTLFSNTDNAKISTINRDLEPELADCVEIKEAWTAYLRHKLYTTDRKLKPEAKQAIQSIFNSSQEHSSADWCSREQLQASPLLNSFISKLAGVKSGDVSAFLRSYGLQKPEVTSSGPDSAADDPATKAKLDIPEKRGKQQKSTKSSKTKGNSSKSASKGRREQTPTSSKSQKIELGLTVPVLEQFCTYKCKDVRLIWKGFLAAGVDFSFNRLWPCDSLEWCAWSTAQYSNLVHVVDEICSVGKLPPTCLHAHEVYPSDAQRSHFTALAGVNADEFAVHFRLLQTLNASLLNDVFPVTCISHDFLLSNGAALAAGAETCIFHHTKMQYMTRCIDWTNERMPDQAAPTVTLDPLLIVQPQADLYVLTNGVYYRLQGWKELMLSYAMFQLFEEPISQLRVATARGADPTYPFNVQFTGEQVHGNSGSFRQFLHQVTLELTTECNGAFEPCASSAVGQNKSVHVMSYLPMTYAHELMLVFTGQLLGCALRAGIPLSLDLAHGLWASLLQRPVTTEHLQQSDIVMYRFLSQLLQTESEDQLNVLIHSNESMLQRFPWFNNTNLSDVNARCHVVRHALIACLEWLASPSRSRAVRAGLLSVIPSPCIDLLTPSDLCSSISGTPDVDLRLLKEHTMYQVGLSESDPHIQMFWTVLESLSAEDLVRFVKFACNQERLPRYCPCQDNKGQPPHVPPFPMKLAPPDVVGNPDTRFIRAETCMFMVKLPQYSSFELMREKLIQAVNSRDDPLIG